MLLWGAKPWRPADMPRLPCGLRMTAPVHEVKDYGGANGFAGSWDRRALSSPSSVPVAPEGEKPADLPVMRAIKFELVINMQTANTLAIDPPPGVLVVADAVIECHDGHKVVALTLATRCQ